MFLEIVCRLRGIEDNGSVEEGEKDDQPNIGDHIERAAVAEIGGDGGENSGAALALREIGDRDGQEQKRGRKNRRYDARCIEL